MAGGIIEDGEVLVRDGAIAAVGGSVAAAYPEEPVCDLGNCALLPGFVNAHSHIEPTLKRNHLDGANLWDWLDALGFRKDTSPDAELLEASAGLGAAECVCSGITCLGDSSFSGASVGAMAAAGLRGIVYLEAFGQSAGEAYAERFALRLDQVCSLTADHPLLDFGISPHSVYTSNRGMLELCAEAADVPIALHLAETQAEAEYSLKGTGPLAELRRKMGYEPMVSGLRPVRYLHEIGLLRKGVCLAHCVDVSGEEADLIAGSGASVAHCPRSNAYLGCGVAPAARLMAAGGVVGIGTDSAASCMRLDFFEEMRFALGMQRAWAIDAAAITAKDVLELATVGGAKALGLGDRIGTIEPGKRADLVAVDLSDVLPGEDIHLAVLSRAPSDVVLVLVDGVEVARCGSPTQVSLADLKIKLRKGMERLSIG